MLILDFLSPCYRKSTQSLISPHPHVFHKHVFWNDWTDRWINGQRPFWEEDLSSEETLNFRWKKKKMYKRYWHKLPKIRGERDLCIISHVLHHYQIYFSNSPGCCIINDCIAKPSKRSCSVIPWCSASASLDLESTLLHTHEVPIMQWLILIKRNTSPTWNGRQFWCIFHLGKPDRGKLLWTEDIRHGDGKTISFP